MKHFEECAQKAKLADQTKSAGDPTNTEASAISVRTVMTNSRNKLGFALGIAGVILFGGTLPATRFAVAAIDPLFLTAARASVAGIAGLAVLVAGQSIRGSVHRRVSAIAIGGSVHRRLST
jgi:hypothetical protein